MAAPVSAQAIAPHSGVAMTGLETTTERVVSAAADE